MVSQIANSAINVVPLNIQNNATYGSPIIQSVRNTKECQVLSQPLPTLDSDEALGFDLLGTKREILITGIVAGTEAQIESFIDVIEAMINGNQFENTVFTHNLSSIEYKEGVVLSIDYSSRKDYLVILKTFTHTYEKGAPSKLMYTLSAVEKVNTATQV